MSGSILEIARQRLFLFVGWCGRVVSSLVFARTRSAPPAAASLLRAANHVCLVWFAHQVDRSAGRDSIDPTFAFNPAVCPRRGNRRRTSGAVQCRGSLGPRRGARAAGGNPSHALVPSSGQPASQLLLRARRSLAAMHLRVDFILLPNFNPTSIIANVQRTTAHQ